MCSLSGRRLSFLEVLHRFHHRDELIELPYPFFGLTLRNAASDKYQFQQDSYCSDTWDSIRQPREQWQSSIFTNTERKINLPSLVLFVTNLYLTMYLARPVVVYLRPMNTSTPRARTEHMKKRQPKITAVIFLSSGSCQPSTFVLGLVIPFRIFYTHLYVYFRKLRCIIRYPVCLYTSSFILAKQQVSKTWPVMCISSIFSLMHIRVIVPRQL